MASRLHSYVNTETHIPLKLWYHVLILFRCYCYIYFYFISKEMGKTTEYYVLAFTTSIIHVIVVIVVFIIVNSER